MVCSMDDVPCFAEAETEVGPALGSQQPRATLWAWGRGTGKLPGGKGPGGVGRQLAEYEPAVCPGGQEGQWHPGLYQK